MSSHQIWNKSLHLRCKYRRYILSNGGCLIVKNLNIEHINPSSIYSLSTASLSKISMNFSSVTLCNWKLDVLHKTSCSLQHKPYTNFCYKLYLWGLCKLHSNHEHLHLTCKLRLLHILSNIVLIQSGVFKSKICFWQIYSDLHHNLTNDSDYEIHSAQPVFGCSILLASICICFSFFGHICDCFSRCLAWKKEEGSKESALQAWRAPIFRQIIK